MENIQYDEISLRELIEVLLKQKTLIIGITIISLLISFVVSFFVLEPVYEAKTILMASRITDKIKPTDELEGIEGILGSVSTYPQLTIETYKEQAKNPVILNEIIKELGLEEKEITSADLEAMIELETIKDTNLITVKVKNTDKKLATDIANTLSNKFINFISEKAKEQATKSSNFIAQQLEIEKKKLDEVLVEYKNFLAQPRGVNELKSEMNMKLQELNQYKDELSKEETKYRNDLLNNEIQEKTLLASLKKTKEELNSTSEKLVTKKSLAQDAFLSEIIKDEIQMDQKDLANIEMYNEQLNPNYISLDSQITNLEIDLAKIEQQKENIKYRYEQKKKILIEKINELKEELEKLQVELAEKQYQERIITRKVNLAQSTYDAFTKKLEESRIAQSSTIGDSSIIVVSPAVEPLKPVSPNKKLNIAIAGVLGIMIGVFVAFFREYWKNSGSKKALSS